MHIAMADCLLVQISFFRDRYSSLDSQMSLCQSRDGGGVVTVNSDKRTRWTFIASRFWPLGSYRDHIVGKTREDREESAFKQIETTQL